METLRFQQLDHLFSQVFVCRRSIGLFYSSNLEFLSALSLKLTFVMDFYFMENIIYLKNLFIFTITRVTRQ